MDAIVIVGEPGVGKSSLVEHLTNGLAVDCYDRPFAHRYYPDADVYELGKRREGGFDGTDALALNVQPKVLDWLAAERPARLLFEGDRLANGSMFEGLVAIGFRLWLYELWGPRVAAAQRERRGSHQDPKWIEGRQTKIRNLRQLFRGVIIPAGHPFDDMAERFTDPVVAALRKAQEVPA